MHITQRMEQLSNAYLRVIAAQSGCNLLKPEVDDDSVDWSLQKKHTELGLPRGRLDVQLKAHALDTVDDPCIKYVLKKKNYDDLRIDEVVPRILVLVCIPINTEEWVLHTEEQLSVKRCAYWLNLITLPDSDNETAVTVHIPRKNMLSPETLDELMLKSARGERI